MAEDNPFSEWSDLIQKPVYSIDRKKLGFLRKILSDYMVVGTGLVNLTKYFIPIALAESVSKKGIRLKITAYEAHLKYSYSKMKNTLISLELIPQRQIEHRRIYDRIQTLRHGANRNRIAAVVAFVAGIVFLLSGYKANMEVYYIIREELMMYTAKEFWTVTLIPIGLLALLSQLGGITVLIGAGLFAANRVNLGKFMVMIGTGQGIFTIGLRIFLELSAGEFSSLENNYITWLTSSAVGLGILFGIISQSISKGRGDGITYRALRFVLRRRKKDAA